MIAVYCVLIIYIHIIISQLQDGPHIPRSKING